MSPDLQSREHLPYITTSLGTRWYHSDPRPEDVHIEFIAHSLARLCRFAGHVNVPMYSVAEHSVRVSACLPDTVPNLWIAQKHHPHLELYRTFRLQILVYKP